MKKDNEEKERIKEENKNLIKKNNELEQQLKEKQTQYNNLLSKIDKNNNNIKSTKIRNDFNPQTNINKNNKISNLNNLHYPLSEYYSPTLVGLNNIGATCFMNSTLQCLSQTKDLTNYFLNEKNEDQIYNNNLALEDKKSLQLSPVYKELIDKLWEERGEQSFSPNNFMNTIEQMNPLFKLGQAGDSKDFIIFILEQFHKELKKAIKTTPTNNEPLNLYDKNNSFMHFFEDFQQDVSIISDTFFGITETTNVCLNCKQNYNSQGLNNPTCYNYEIFNCLIFPLEEVKNMKNNNSMQNSGGSYQMNNYNYNNYNNNQVTLYDCFFYNQKTELFNGENQNYCNICKQLSDSLYTSRIFSSPKILVLILNRGKNNIYNVKLNFEEKINITQFVLQRDTPQLIYSLYGVITHHGQSGPSAHFMAACKSPIDNKWYRYNDAFVTPINNVKKDVIDFGTPYILFYQKE